MADDFSDPTSVVHNEDAEFFKPALAKDRLVLTEVVEHDPARSQFGEVKNAVKVVVTVLDGPQAGTKYLPSWLAQVNLVRALEGSVGGKVLGRLSLRKIDGGKTVWDLNAVSDSDKATARAYLAKSSDAPF